MMLYYFILGLAAPLQTTPPRPLPRINRAVRLRAILCLALTIMLGVPASGAAHAAGAPTVVASIKPIHALVAGVMEGVGTPLLLVTGLRSEHDFTLKPSDATALEAARLIFWMGPSMEGFLARPIKSVAAGVSVPLGERLGPLLRPLRLELMHEPRGNPEDAHDIDNDGQAGHGHAPVGPDGKPLPDLHAWLDPRVAAAMVGVIATELSRADPVHAARYAQNAATLNGRLATLDRELEESLAPLLGRPFIVFHDAFQYFERRYGLSGVGSLSIEPHNSPGARHLAALRDRIETGRVVCVFAEPQFEPKLVHSLIEGTPARAGTLDPIGAGQEPGLEAYFGLMRAIAASLKACLAG